MKAVVWSGYGSPDVLQWRDVPEPEPKSHQIKIQIHATTAFPADCEMRRFEMPMPVLWLPMRLFFGWSKPRGIKILGQEFAGVVTEVGNKVSQYQLGDRVFGCTGVTFGSYAEYLCCDEQAAVAKVPANIAFCDIVPLATGGSNAMHFLQLAKILPGESVLICGAAGCIGTFAVQIAKQMGAYVIAVDKQDKLAFLTSLGADEAISPNLQNSQRSTQYDVIFDVVGKMTYPQCLQQLTPQGRYLSANPHLSQLLGSRNKPVILTLAKPSRASLEALAQWLVDGRIHACIDQYFCLQDASAAHQYVESGKKVGHVVMILDSVVDRLSLPRR